MSADRTLLDTLKNYLSQHTGPDPSSLRQDAPWPEAFTHWQDSLPLFQWAGAEPAPRFFGIRRLVDQSPFRLSELRSRGYTAESIRHPVRPPVKKSVEHYLVAEVTAPEAAVVYLCMHSPSGEWYVLDEHRISRS